MGVFGGRDNFSAKWITAVIVDPQNRMHLVPIKHTISDEYFLADINDQVYAFKIVHSRIMIWYATLTRSFRVMWYTTSHYMPVSAQDNKELELVLEKNSLPKMNKLQFTILQQLARREKKTMPEKFAPHKLQDLVKEINKHPERNTEKLQNIKTYLEELNTEQIVTPVRNITDFLQEDLIVSDSNFLATVPDAMMRADEENRRITNSEIKAKKGWMKLVLVMLGIAVIGMVLYMAYSSGAFDGIAKPLEGFGAVGEFFKTQGGGNRPAGMTSGLPAECTGTPEACKEAVNSGRVKIGELPAELRKVIESMPSVTPKNHEVKIGG